MALEISKFLLHNKAMPPRHVDLVANRLTALRLALDLTPGEICRKTGLKPNRWSQYENGKRLVTLAAALRLRDRFGVTLDWIYCGDRACLPRHLDDRIPITVA